MKSSEKNVKKNNTKKSNTKKVKTNKESFFKGIKKEMKLVKWPSGKEVVKYTIATVAFCLIVCAFFLLLYFLLTAIVGEI